MQSPSVLVSPAQALRGWRTMMTQLINLKPPRRASRIRRARCVASGRVPTAPPRSRDSLDGAGGSCRWCAPAVCAGPPGVSSLAKLWVASGRAWRGIPWGRRSVDQCALYTMRPLKRQHSRQHPAFEILKKSPCMRWDAAVKAMVDAKCGRGAR
jgi:hypothetical protein